MGQSYNRLGRRRGSGAWQWMLIGFIPGILCGGIVIFALALGGFLESFSSAEPTSPPPTQVVLVVTATNDPALPTATPLIITATPEPTTEVAQSDVIVASSTPTTQIVLATETPADNNSADVVPSATAVDLSGAQSADDVEATLAPQVAPPTLLADTADAVSDIPEVLASLITTMVSVPGGIYTKGTTPSEVLVAVDECINRDEGNCLPAYGEDASPAYQVSLDPFQIEVTEVTFQQYVAFLNWLRSQGRDHLTGCDGFMCIQTINEAPNNAVITFDSANYNAPPGLISHPVYGVTWYGANAYCSAIGRRLPTEAEWERAARGDDGRIYPWGNTFDSNLAKTRIPRDAPPGTVPVGTYTLGASPYGALDMAGNVAEWVSDWYSEDYYNQLANQTQPVVDPQGPPIALQKVLRGGSWDGLPFFARSVHRQSWFPAPDSVSEAYPRWVGFRCVDEVDNTAAISSGAVDPTTLGSDVVAPVDATPDTNAQPTLPAPPEAVEPTSDASNRG
jgi:formylglycine-generating enzyme required for sulfatase activity